MTIGVTAAAAQPGARSVSAMVAKVIGYVSGLQTDPDVQKIALDGLNDAIDKINSVTWLEALRGSQTLNQSTSTTDHLLNTDFKKPIHMERLNASGNPDGRYDYTSFKEFMRKYPVATAPADPTAYTILYDATRVARFNFTPPAGFVALYPKAVLYYDRWVLHGTFAGAIDLPGDFASFIEWHAKGFIASDRDPSRANLALSMASRAFDRLRVKDNNTRTDWSER